MSIRGVILDVDGTLVDSNDAHAYSWVEVLSEYGYRVPYERVRELIGKGGDKLLPEATGLPQGSPEGEAISQRRAEIFRTKYLPRLRPLSGAHRLLETMRDRGLKLVVASSAKRDELRPLLAVIGANDLIDDQASSDDAPRSKPDPDIVVAALDRCGCRADEVVMIGDTPYDVEAAHKAGIRAIALRCGGWDDTALNGAEAIYDDPSDLLDHLEESPLGATIH